MKWVDGDDEPVQWADDLPDDWEAAPDDPPDSAAGETRVTVVEGHTVLRPRVGSGDLQAATAWLSAPQSAWTDGETAE